jgi:hypothetical protein
MVFEPKSAQLNSVVVTVFHPTFITVEAKAFLRLERNGFREILSVKPVLRKYPNSKKKMSN